MVVLRAIVNRPYKETTTPVLRTTPPQRGIFTPRPMGGGVWFSEK